MSWLVARQGVILHLLLLTFIAAGLYLPGLGRMSLWDDDEALNAEAGREMLEAGTWIIPTFNFELRTAKPVMLYWWQRGSYSVFGVSEWSARLPSVLAGVGSLLLTYLLARRMFDPRVGLLAALVLASTIEFALLTHAATPDALLLFFTLLTYTAFWFGQQRGGRSWWLPTAAACGLAVLTKGPVGVVMPALVILFYFILNREPGRLLDRRIVPSLILFLLVAAPWYIWVTVETRGAWLEAFILNDNVKRALTPLENHRGPFYYHAVALLLLFAPWSIFIGGVLWFGVKQARRSAVPATDASAPPFDPHSLPGPSTPLPVEDSPSRAYRFLIAWFSTYLLVFSLAATKLPNYAFPLYPALAILTAAFLVAWRDGRLRVPGWLFGLSIAGMGLVAIALALGLLIAGGVIPTPSTRTFPGLERWALLAIIPALAVLAMIHTLRRQNRDGFLRVTTLAALALVALALLPALEMERYKASRSLVRTAHLADSTRDIRLASFGWFKPTVVFYSQRQVQRLTGVDDLRAFLANPTPAYLFVPENLWANLQQPLNIAWREAARHYDFYTHQTILVVSNEGVAQAPTPDDSPLTVSARR